jgi:hypothetical protein
MHVPVLALVALVLLSVPTILVLAAGIDDWARDRDLALLGRVSRWREDGTYLERTCVLCVPVWTERGCHSTALHD